MKYIYIGSFNHSKAEGIHICRYDQETGNIHLIRTVLEHINATDMVCIGNKLLVADEQRSGYVYELDIDPDTGDLYEKNKIDTLAVNPSHITLDSSKEYAIVTHFAFGEPVRVIEQDKDGFKGVWMANESATCLYKVNQDGSLGELLDVGHHHDEKNLCTMFHQAQQQPGGDLYAEVDLEGNRIYFFELQRDRNKLNYRSSLYLGEGRRGARIGIFHPGGRWLYVNYMFSDRISQVDLYDPDHPVIVDHKKLIPDEDLSETDNSSAMLIHPFIPILYNFVRGKGYALVYRINDETGKLTLVQKLKMQCADPRDARFTSKADEILVTGNADNEVIRLNVAADGILREKAEVLIVSHPASIAVYEG